MTIVLARHSFFGVNGGGNMAASADISQRVYPAMSHPTADPAVAAVAARFAGLEPPAPAGARILEIGCASGHHLLPLAMRWPEARLAGIDISAPAIHMARTLASDAGLFDRVDLRACALEEFSAGPAGSYDYIIAHGFYSWVPDEVKQCLLDFCARHLTPNGLAVISFNVAAGWVKRQQVVSGARAIQQAGGGPDAMAALDLMRDATDDAETHAIIGDMLAKGPEILPFDDFAPVNDPWRLDDFVSAAAAAGLRWLGESRVADNRPPGWSAADEAQASMMRGSLTPVGLHQWMDEHAGRTFRSALLCRADAPVSGRLRTGDVFGLALRPAAAEPPVLEGPGHFIHHALMDHWPSAVPAQVLLEEPLRLSPQEIARVVCQGLIEGWLWARCEPLAIPRGIPERPRLDPLRLACARRRLPVVDAWHRPCSFPDGDYALLGRIDGRLTHRELKELASKLTPRLDFARWLAHLHERGFFLESPPDGIQDQGMD
jgi:SAM-dependent methyltransferase